MKRAEEEEHPENDEEEQGESTEQSLTDAFGFASIGYDVATEEAKKKDVDKKAKIFQGKLKLDSDFSGAGAAEVSSKFVTAGSKGKLVIECGAVCDNDPKCLEILKQNTDADEFSQDILECFATDIRTKVKQLDNDMKDGDGTFEKLKAIFLHAKVDAKIRKKLRKRRPHINVAGSPCPNYSRAKKGRKGKNGKGCHVSKYIYINTSSCMLCQTESACEYAKYHASVQLLVFQLVCWHHILVYWTTFKYWAKLDRTSH